MRNADIPLTDPDREWLDHVRPVGLVVAPERLRELGLVPELQTRADNAAVAALLGDPTDDGPSLPDPWAFFSDILGWPAARIEGAPDGPALDDRVCVHLPDYDTTLEPQWAVQAAGKSGAGANGAPRHQLLVRLEAPGVDPDARGGLDGWEATPQHRFERLLRESGIEAGVLVCEPRQRPQDAEIRLVYAPKGETSGWLAFPLQPLTTVAGRSMLGGLKLMLGVERLFTAPESHRLSALLRESRAAQASVSTKLSGQVLGALHDLLRGFKAAEPDLIAGLVEHRPQHLYEGLLTVLLRLVFILFAEDRDLLPARTDAAARDLYERGYALRGLHARLLDDRARHPDTMDERVGGWGQILALFRMIHGGVRGGFMIGRGGTLFDPTRFPFLEGRATPDQASRVPALTDGTVLAILDGLLMLDGERLSYRTLDVEQIGSVYETVMGFTVEAACGPVLAIRGGKRNAVPVYVDLDELVGLKAKDRLKRLKEGTHRTSFGAGVERALKAANDRTALAAALEPIADERGSPGAAVLPAGAAILQPTDERRRTGSHYTPRDLSGPIVRQTLAPALERLGPDATPAQVLDLKVCDPAMGSGAFLVEACRVLAEALVAAWARHPGSRPQVPSDEDEDLLARRLVAQRCLYGVDRNPMAVDLARLSLWLATLARDHEFTFLDHALKAGDSLVGLTLTAIGALHWAPGGKGVPLLSRHVRQRIDKVMAARREIREAPDDVAQAVQEVRLRQVEPVLDEVRRLGDAVIAAFFSADRARAREKARQDLESWHDSPAEQGKVDDLRTGLRRGEHPVTPFHWPVEFPEVFVDRPNPGFDAIVGNPPFAGKNTLAAGHRAGYADWLKTINPGAHGNSDVVAHFFRRAFGLIREGGAFGLIATNTIRQGDTRATGLTAILKAGGAISHATRRLKWPGDAAVVVSVVTVVKGTVAKPLLDGRLVERISAYLVDGPLDDSPQRLTANRGKAFQGSIVLGMGFTFDDVAAAKGEASSLADMERLIEKDPRNAERIFPYIGGQEVNNDPRQRHRRYVIDFEDFPLRRDPNTDSWWDLSEEARDRQRRDGIMARDYPGPVAADWPDLLEIIERTVRPERATDNRPAYRNRWWRFAERRSGLYCDISSNDWVYATSSKASPQFLISILQSSLVFSQNLNVFLGNDIKFSCIQCRIHETWARFFGTTFKDDLTYTVSDCFFTFPFLNNSIDPALEAAGRAYHDHRAALMIARDEGLTKTYNRFHTPREKSADIVRLRELHTAMDHAVLRAYGWDDLIPDAVPEFLTEDTEADFTYQGRLFWPAPVRDEVLARLLALNAERAAAEQALGLTAGPRDDAGDDAEDDGDETKGTGRAPDRQGELFADP
ncbi:DNA methyltransferase [Roseospira goensis]|uniref:site-specific DNA-methyltransferase (adenine-specific) n=1 Tax=Roseospira goensis TaxID=391922 RepID=A0A7W6WLB4_9PROT|nr:DNA methyltransferase [Roseospira goensis]MBB4287236.1 hypothetical protein [Roseospira goensis]